MAVVLERTGIYTGIFAPGYPAFLAVLIHCFGHNAILAAKLVQVGASVVIGACVMRLAERLFGRVAALQAGWIWALYLPLAGYTHMLWTETVFLAVFLPAMVALLAATRNEDGPQMDVWLAVAGALIGVSMLIKEAAVLFAPAAALWVGGVGAPVRAWRLRRMATLLLATCLVVLPWTLRNADTYRAFVPVGLTLGVNVYRSLNGRYVNPDYSAPDLAAAYGGSGLVYDTFIAPGPEPWKAPRRDRRIDREREKIRLGLAYALRHPGYVALGRAKKLADLLSPVSFVLRACRKRLYGGWLRGMLPRRVVTVAALLSAAALLALGFTGVAWWWAPQADHALVLLTIGYFGLTGLLTAGSRFRVPFVPLLIVYAAGALALRVPESRARRIASVVVVVLLAALWALNARGVAFLLAHAW